MSLDKDFKQFNLDKSILEAISKKGFEKPSDIQQKVIPVILEQKNDLIGIAQTGTGKTAAFGLPVLSLVEKDDNGLPQVLILTPTRELALQINEEMKSYLGSKKLRLLSVYGGASISTQVAELKKGAEIIVGTPGRVVDMIKRGALKLSQIKHFILDEADEMLNMGFMDDLEFIFNSCQKDKKVYLFSATMPKKVRELAKKYMQKTIEISVERKESAKRNIDQKAIIVKHSHKDSALITLISILDPFYGIIFCKTKQDVEDVTQSLKQHKILASCIHGDIPQNRREKILQQFRDYKLDVLVATDVAARGIDIEHLTHVINYSIPQELETYVHRIGRVGRAGKTGTAITFVTPRENFLIRQLENITKTSITIEKLPTRDDVEAKKIENLFAKMGEIIHSGETFKREIELVKAFSVEEKESILLASLKILIEKSLPSIPTQPQNDIDDEPNQRRGSQRGGRDNRRSSSSRSFSNKSRSEGDNRENRYNRESRDSRNSRGSRDSRENYKSNSNNRVGGRSQGGDYRNSNKRSFEGNNRDNRQNSRKVYEKR